jgi:UDP-N-acetylmuramoyl-tripeptide--D-alanyl-D-alanine ligase
VIALWTAHDLLEATGGTMGTPFVATGVSIDTRTIQPGDLFVALHGEMGDGHGFVADALAKGAAGAMVHRHVPNVGPVLLVDDTLAGLHRLGGYARERYSGRLVAVTGSVGKTTTKEMLRTILTAFGRTHAAVASYNNQWGLPLTLARMPPDAEFCVAEIGMNHAGEIAPLARLARPHVAVITAVEKAHIGFLGSIEAIADEKAEILRALEPGGVAVLPADTPLLPRLRAAAGSARVVTFGAAPTADARLVGLQMDADGSDVAAEVEGQPVTFRLNAPGRHMAMNALAALAAAGHLARRAEEAAERSGAGEVLQRFAPVIGRGARRQIALAGGTALLLDESYNGNPASMRAALAVLRLQPARRRIVVLGDMLELGDAGPAEHRALAVEVAASADHLFACGPLMRDLFAAVPAAIRVAHTRDSASLAPILARFVTAGDAVLIKGSLGSRMKLVVNALEPSADAA